MPTDLWNQEDMKRSNHREQCQRHGKAIEKYGKIWKNIEKVNLPNVVRPITIQSPGDFTGVETQEQE